MEKGHIELGEILFVLLLAVGIAAAIILIIDGNGGYVRIVPVTENASSPAAPPAVSNQTANAPNVTENQSQAAPEPIPVTNKSVGRLIEDGLARADAWFMSTGPLGNFDRDTYGWAMGVANQSPDAIPVKANDLRAVEVRFNGRYDDGLRAFTFRHYTSPTLSEPARLYAVAVFISEPTLVDGAGQEFEIQYDPYPEGPQTMEGCTVIDSSQYVTAAGSPVNVYDIKCKIMYGVYP